MYQVLVIDDDKLARKGLISLIPWEKYGMEVAGDVANGALALQFIETHPVDLAVVDLTMPVLSGLELSASAGRGKFPWTILCFPHMRILRMCRKHCGSG